MIHADAGLLFHAAAHELAVSAAGGRPVRVALADILVAADPAGHDAVLSDDGARADLLDGNIDAVLGEGLLDEAGRDLVDLIRHLPAGNGLQQIQRGKLPLAAGGGDAASAAGRVAVQVDDLWV